MNDNLTKHILNKGSTHSVVKINNVLFGKRQSIVKLQLMKIYCACFYGSYVTQAWQKATADYCWVYGVIHFTSPAG